MRAALALLVAASPGTAWAWNVACTNAAGADCKDVYEEVQTEWVQDPRAEHRGWLEKAIGVGGLPASLLDSFDLTVFASDTRLTGPDGTVYDSVRPVPRDPARQRTRTLSVPMMANLPDFAYTLWDWASGAELCPPAPATASVDCHDYPTHIGWLNSDHFPPQSRKFYEHLHAVAMDRAASCKKGFDATPAADRDRLQDYFLACERLALVIEGAGHHFLQDSWAMGHMWERWGSTDPADWNNQRSLGLVVSAFTGLLHGGKELLDSTPPLSALKPWDDPMNAPHPDEVWADATGVHPGVGDIFAPMMTTAIPAGDPFGPQRRALLGCAVSGLREVYAATPEIEGPMTMPDPAEIDGSRSIHDDSCWRQRATNRAIATGMGAHHGQAPNEQRYGTVPSLLVIILGSSDFLPAKQGLLPLDLFTLRKFQLDAAANATLAFARGLDPSTADGIDLASGGLLPLVGIQPGGVYARGDAAAKQPPVFFADPFPPWKLNDTGPLADAQEALNLTFADGSALDRCDELTTADLQTWVDSAKAARQSQPEEVVSARCGQCVQLVTAHLRHGNEGSHDARREPLCGLAAPAAAAFLYTGEDPSTFTGTEPNDLASARDAARRFCGCAQMEVAGGTFQNGAASSLGTALLVRLRRGNGDLPGATTVTVHGPAGWNGDQPLPLDYPSGGIRQFYTLAVAPVTGDYLVEGDPGDGPVQARAKVDAASVLDDPGPPVPDLDTSGAVGSVWGQVTGASSYLTRVFDITRQRILLPTVFTHEVMASLGGVPVNGAHQSALQVFAFSNDMTPPDPPVPARFDVSFNRTILTASVTVSPASAQVVAGKSQDLSAVVKGLPPGLAWTASGGSIAAADTGATWTAPAASGSFLITATSTANTTFRGVASMRVVGSQCDPKLVAKLFVGTWVGGGAGIAAGGPGQDFCGGSVYDDFQTEGQALLTIESDGTVTPSGGFKAWKGTFHCNQQGLEVFDDVAGDFSFSFYYPLLDIVDPEQINGSILLKVPGTKIVPCDVDYQGQRQP